MVLVLSPTRFVKVSVLMFRFSWVPILPMKLPGINFANQLLVVLGKMQKFSKSFSNDLLSGKISPHEIASLIFIFQGIDQ